jgi:hypothetical protein
MRPPSYMRGPGSSVGIATGYGLDCPGIESRWARDFSHTPRPALGPTQPPVQWVLDLSHLTPVQTAVTQYSSPYTSTESCHSVQQSLTPVQTAVTQYSSPYHQYRQLSLGGSTPYTNTTDSCHSVQQFLHQYRQLSLSTAVLTPVQTAVTQ